MKCGTELCDPCLRDLEETSTSGVNPKGFMLPDAAVGRLAQCVPHGQQVIHAASEFRPITRFRLEELQQASKDLCGVETGDEIVARARTKAEAKVEAMAEAMAQAKIAAMTESTAEERAEAKAQAKTEAVAQLKTAAKAKSLAKSKEKSSANAVAEGIVMVEPDPNANADPKPDASPGTEAHLYEAPEKALNRPVFTINLAEKKDTTYKQFRRKWAAGSPILVHNFEVRCSPARILDESKQQRCSIVDCETSVERKGTLAGFFKGFNKVSKRLEKVKVGSLGLPLWSLTRLRHVILRTGHPRMALKRLCPSYMPICCRPSHFQRFSIRGGLSTSPHTCRRAACRQTLVCVISLPHLGVLDRHHLRA
jgi:hypothetical protein